MCEYLEISIRTIQHWEKNGSKDKRKGASKCVRNKLTATEESEIVKTCCNSRFMNLTPYEIVPILAEEGKYIASVSSFYRVLDKAGLLFCKRKYNKQSKKNIPEEIKASAPYEILSWDISWLKTNIQGKYYYLYMFVDIWSRYIVGWKVHEKENGQLAKELVNEINKDIDIKGSILHSDNGSPMRCSTMRATLEKLGVSPSFSRPYISNDNAYSESLFKTLKYKAGYPKCFRNIESAREWVAEFVNWYNKEHRHSKIGHVTPSQRLTGEDKKIFAKRNKAFAEARKRNPERWSKQIKKWSHEKDVVLKKGNIKRKAA